MDLVIPDHAREQMELRGVTEQEVIAVLENPALDQPNKEGKRRWEAWGRVSDGWLRVVYRKQGKRTALITVTTSSRGP